jgi:Arylsulfotransferase (ASST)
VTPHRPLLRYFLAAAAAAACVSVAAASTAAAAAPIGAYVRTGASRYVSQPRLAPPKLKVLKRARGGQLAPGYFLISNFKNLGTTKPGGGPAPLVGQGGPVMYDKHLQPVWIHGVPDNKFGLNFRTQSYNGKPALSWWEGNITPTGDVLSGEDFVVDQHYKIVAKLVGQKPWLLSQHEFAITGGHFAWVTAYRTVSGQDLGPYGGSTNGQVLDCAVQEYDLSTGKLVYSWDALDHIPLSDAEAPPLAASNPKASTTPWDAFHLNNVQPLPNGQFLVSLRTEWAAYLVTQSTSAIAWKLGGKNSSFTIGAGASFSYQHDVQLHSNGTVSMFDNGCCGLGADGKFLKPNGSTRGLVMKLDTTSTPMAATLGQQYSLKGVLSGTQGNTQLLPNGNALVGFGQQPFFAEYGKTGNLLFEAEFPSPDSSYRAFVGRWTGQPLGNPSGAARTTRGKTTAYASWNGATNVYSWRVLAGHDAKHLGVVATKSRTGFETPIPLKSSYGAYQVVALGNKKQVLKRSSVFATARAKAHKPPASGFY